MATIYADKKYYAEKYLTGRESVIEERSIDFFLRKALQTIKPHIIGNIDEGSEIPEELKMCQCEIAEILYVQSEREKVSGGVISESVSGWSKSYENSEQLNLQTEKKILSCIYSWLSGTGLLFKGVKL